MRAGDRSRGLDVALWCAVLAYPSAAQEPARAELTRVPGASAAEPVAPPLRTLTLEVALAEARAKHPSMQLAANQARRADALVEQARAAAFPSLTGNVVYTRLDGDRVLGGRLLASGNQASGNLALVVPLAVPKAWGQWAHATDARDVALASARDAERVFLVGVARTFLGVVGQRRLVEVARRARDTAVAHEKYASTRFDGGVGNRLDAIRARQERAASEVLVANTEQVLERLREALGMLVGADGAVDAADDVRFEDPRNSAETLDDVVAKRSDVAVLERARRAAATVVKDSWLDYLPYLNGAFTPFFQNPSTATQPELGWQAQLLLGVPLFDGGTRYGVHAERRALETDAALRLEQALTQARSELRVAAQAVARADRTLEAAREAEAHAREALALANEAYRAGATRSLEVVDAERRARDAETQVAIAEDAARQARLELLVASGRFP